MMLVESSDKTDLLDCADENIQWILGENLNSLLEQIMRNGNYIYI